MSKRNDGIQLVLPMAGSGQRFVEAGYETPKPLLDIHGARMFEVVLGNLLNPMIVSVTFVTRKEWKLRNAILDRYTNLSQTMNVIEIDYMTEGPASTVAITQRSLDPALPLIVANSDQFVDADMTTFASMLLTETVSGVVLTMEDNDAKWSYVRLDNQENIEYIAEKSVISNLATVGIYGFKRADEFLKSYRIMVDADDRVNNEFYVGPLYNYLSREAGPVKSVNLGPIDTVMYGMGIPRDYEAFLHTEASFRAADSAKRFLGDNEPSDLAL